MIFFQDHYLLQRCHQGACANIIFALARSRHVLDGYVRKSLPVQLNLHQPAGAALSRPCRFELPGLY